MEVQSGLYGFDREELTELLDNSKLTAHTATYGPVQATITPAAAEGGEVAKPVYAVAQDSEGLQKLLQQANLQKGDTVTIENVAEGEGTSLALSGLPSSRLRPKRRRRSRSTAPSLAQAHPWSSPSS